MKEGNDAKSSSGTHRAFGSLEGGQDGIPVNPGLTLRPSASPFHSFYSSPRLVALAAAVVERWADKVPRGPGSRWITLSGLDAKQDTSQGVHEPLMRHQPKDALRHVQRADRPDSSLGLKESEVIQERLER